MQCLNTINKLIVAPALVIALTTGSVMAGPGQHFDVKAHHSAQIGQSSIFEGGTRHASDIGTPFGGEMVNRTADTSSLEATQQWGAMKQIFEAKWDTGTFGDNIDFTGWNVYFLDLPDMAFGAQNLVNLFDIDPQR